MSHYSRFKSIIILTYVTSIALCNYTNDQKALIYHTVPNKDVLDNVKKTGLYSCLGLFTSPKQLLSYKKENNLSYSEVLKMPFLISFNHFYRKFKKLGFEDQLNVIYFKPEEPGAKEIANFAYPVNPNQTYVYNLHYRTGICDFDDECQKDDALYRSSRVLLSDYLIFLQEAQKMVESQPDTTVQLDPQTARPFYVTKDQAEKSNPRDFYSGEVIIARRHIPASELIPVQDKIGTWTNIQPVKNRTK